ncbi:MAG: hypothetical protein IKV35_00915, partial [Clostridia bacterium]|nr:hypothetical protein [Clostridia bacterium]
PELQMDFRLTPSQIDVGKLDELDRLEPFGAGNPSALFCLYNMTVENVTAVAAKHTRLTLSKDGVCVNAIRFGAPPETLGLAAGDKIHLAVTLDRNEFRGTVSVSIIVKDIRYADTAQEDIITAIKRFDRVMCREALTAEEAASVRPEREHMAALYRMLKGNGGYDGTWERLYHIFKDSVPCDKLRPACEVLKQADLITLQNGGDTVTITVCDVNGKADLMKTPLMEMMATY